MRSEASDGSVLTVVKRLGIALLVPLFACGQSITGKIVDPISLPLRNVPVGLLPAGADGVTKSTHTDSNGKFRFSPVEPGEYVVIARAVGFRGKVLAIQVISEEDADVGTLKLTGPSCDSQGVNCDTFGTPPPDRPPIPVVDLCEALKDPARYGNNLIIIVGVLTALHGWPAVAAACDAALASDGLSWTNAVLLPEKATPQRSPKFPSIPNLKRKLSDRAEIVRKSAGSSGSRVVAVYGFLDIPDGLSVVPCAGNPCPVRPDILIPPASFLRVDGFQELK